MSPGPSPTTASRPLITVLPARHQHHGKIRCTIVLFGRERNRYLSCHGAPFNVNGTMEATGAFKRTTHFRQIAAELNHDHGIRLDKPPFKVLLPECAGNHREHVITLRNWRPDCRPASRHSTHAGDDFCLKTACQAHVEVHVGTVEERVTLADHGDEKAIVEVRCKFASSLVIKRANDVAIRSFVTRQLGRHRKDQRQFPHSRFKVAGSDDPGISGLHSFGEMRHDIGLLQHADRLQRDELGVAWSNPNADELPGDRHFLTLASALTAAAAIALPPIRPSTVRNGMPREFSTNASFASAAPTKPTGMPRTAAGLAAPASSISSK